MERLLERLATAKRAMVTLEELMSLDHHWQYTKGSRGMRL